MREYIPHTLTLLLYLFVVLLNLLVILYENRSPNETIFQIGDHASCFYVILNGVTKVKGREAFGQPLKTVSVLTGGQSFGELALLKDSQRLIIDY